MAWQMLLFGDCASGHYFSPIYDVCCWHLYILACLIFPLDNTTSSCEDKSNTFFLYYFEFRRRNSLRHNLNSNLYLLFIKRPFGLFDTSVSGLHPTILTSTGFCVIRPPSTDINQMT